MDHMGDRLKEERGKTGLSQQGFAALGGVEANAQSHYESGKRVPKADYLAAIAKGGVDILYVVLGKRTPTAADSLNEEERTVLEHYRSLDTGDQRAIGHLSSSLSDCD
ncbi:MAG TPA: helix-turn-helix transcriptional regulator [Pseudomonas sp.]|jgi:transcriptional regulator with XRE-family HTH domain